MDLAGLFREAKTKHADPETASLVEQFARAQESAKRPGVAEAIRRAARDNDLAYLRRLAQGYGGVDLYRHLEG